MTVEEVGKDEEEEQIPSVSRGIVSLFVEQKRRIVAQ